MVILLTEVELTLTIFGMMMEIMLGTFVQIQLIKILVIQKLKQGSLLVMEQVLQALMLLILVLEHLMQQDYLIIPQHF